MEDKKVNMVEELETEEEEHHYSQKEEKKETKSKEDWEDFWKGKEDEKIK